MSETASEQLSQLLGYLDRDPRNLNLLGEAALAAGAARDGAKARELIDRYKALDSLPPALRGLEARLLMGAGQFVEAVAAWRALLESVPDDLAVRSSLAWALVSAGDEETALAHLDEDTVAVWPQAAELRIRLLHKRGDLEEALDVAHKAVRYHPHARRVFASACVLAFDLEQEATAIEWADKAGDLPEALSTRAMIDIRSGDFDLARQRIDQALADDPAHARGWLARGMLSLVRQQPEEAIAPLTRGAEIFGDNLGSWIMVGWAQLLAGDHDEAATSFQRTLDIDPTFAESHGSMAVIHALRGETDQARRMIEIARRLDPQSFSAIFAQMMLSSAAGNEEQAQLLFRKALKSPIDEQGRTLEQMLATLGFSA